jgi:histone H3/H4
MSDFTHNPPHRISDPSRENRNGERSMTAAAPRDACAMLMKPAEVAKVVNRWQKDAFAWLNETLSARASGEDPLYLATPF